MFGCRVRGTKGLGRIGWVSPFLRKVKTASGATAVQIVEKRGGVRTILEHLGSAHDEAELAALLRIGHDKLHANQPMLEFPWTAGGASGGGGHRGETLPAAGRRGP